MAIFPVHMAEFSEILALPGFLASPFLEIGCQGLANSDNPEYQFPTLSDLLRARGITELDELDPFDANANLQWNLNYPVPIESHEKYATVLDIGCVEHIFDTRAVFENCLRMVKVGGLYAVHTPVSGHVDHGLHTFHSELVPRLFEANNFEPVYQKYMLQTGKSYAPPPGDGPYGGNADGFIWAVGRKTKPLETLIIPEQARYSP